MELLKEEKKTEKANDSDTAKWMQNGGSYFICSACGAHAPRKLYYCNGCDREMTNHD